MQRISSFHESRSSDNRRNAMSTSRKVDTIAVLLLGKCEAGKTALANRWINGVFIETYEPTIEDFHEKSVNFNHQSINIALIDMTGTSDFPAMIDLYLNRVDSVLLVYDVGDESSMKELTHLYERVRKVREQRQDLLISIVGTKIDKKEDMCAEYQNETVAQILKDIGPNAKHVLTSARQNWNVNEVFESVLNNMVTAIIPNEDTIKRLRKLMKKNRRSPYMKWCTIL